MARFHGKIGYSNQVQVSPGVWQDQPTEREYFGDVIRESKQWTAKEQVNDDLVINNRISVVADDFASSNFSAMRYVIWAGTYWRISNIDVQRPRLILSLGGVYNGPKA